MKKLTTSLVGLAWALSMSQATMAGEVTARASASRMSAITESFNNHTNVGLGLITVMTSSDSDVEEYLDIGPELYGTWSIKKHLALRAGGYYLVSPNDKAESVLGLRIGGMVGYGLRDPGFRLYLSGGMYNESWSWEGTQRESERHGGWYAGFGLGYSGERFSIDAAVNYRDTSSFASAQQEFYGYDSLNVESIQFGGSLKYRF